ncbi:MAG: DNA repair protein RadA, partial [Eubacteriales bacterium]|nr:DNA repair protein RadA [Eubacteriales bacterium]
EGVMSFGEVGLTGELRAVSAAGQRIHEAIRLGFTTCIMPKQDVGRIAVPDGFRMIQVDNIAQAIGAAFGK